MSPPCSLCGEPLVFIDVELWPDTFIERWYCPGELVFEKVIV